MFIKNYHGNKFLFNHSRKGFFLKFLKNKGLINLDETNVLKKNESIDFKDLMDENKLRITYYDIFKDYRNFSDAYYYFRVKIQEDPNNPINQQPKLPFDSKSMDLKKVLNYALIPVNTY